MIEHLYRNAPEGRVTRWKIYLQNFDVKSIQHIEGASNVLVDALSRYSKPTLQDRDPEADGNLVFAITEISDLRMEDLLQSLGELWEQDCDYKRCRHVKSHLSRFIKLNGLVYYLNRDGKQRLYTPILLRSQIVKFYYKSYDHVGISKTLTIIRRYFNWPACKMDVIKFVKGGSECQKCKNDFHPETGPFTPIKATTKGEAMAIDYFGPLPTGQARLSYIFVTIDLFTKYVKLLPLKRTTTDTTIRAMDKYVAEYGTRGAIISDNGRQFVSLEWQDHWY